MTNSAGYIYNNKFDGHTELEKGWWRRRYYLNLSNNNRRTVPPLRELVYTHEQQRYTDIYTQNWLIMSRVLSSFEL